MHTQVLIKFVYYYVYKYVLYLVYAPSILTYTAVLQVFTKRHNKNKNKIKNNKNNNNF